MTRSADGSAVLCALDEAAFGSGRTLNLRESLPSADQARTRAESWLRERQMTLGGEVLVITGRGNNSPDGVSAVRTTISSLLQTLQRKNVVRSWKQHSPGSFVAMLAPASELFDAPTRRKDRPDRPTMPKPGALAGLSNETLVLLRMLATRSLQSLGVKDTAAFLTAEMEKKFTAISGALGATLDESNFRTAVERALDEID
jgi:Smr domain.